jgi:hemoglobin
MLAAMPDQPVNLYQRIGGEAGIERLVTDFYERVLADPELTQFFQHIPMDKLRTMQKEFFSEALGGPLFYSGRSLRDVHAGRGISKAHLGRFLQHLLETISALDLDRREIDAIYSRIATEADEISGGITESA